MNNPLTPTIHPCKIFIPDWTDNYDKPYCVPAVYPFLNSHRPGKEWADHFGDYVNKITIVPSIEQCDIVMLMYELGYYYKNRKLDELWLINKEAISHRKLFICWSKGDHGITPSLLNFHLYRVGGYKSRNKGNEFSVPVFIKDPLPGFFNGVLPIRTTKAEKALIGFCGQGRGGVGKLMIDVVRGVKNKLYNYCGEYPFDLEKLYSSTYMRSKILDALEKSSLVETNFIRHRKYRAGSTSEAQKKESSKAFFKNMGESEYVVCYRGAGNFSVRLFETMASGKIPVIITSDNNLPFEDTINWNIFPVIPENQWRKTDEIVAAFHAKLSNKEFIELQYKSRELWETYLSYKGFFSQWINRYMQYERPARPKILLQKVDVFRP